MLMYLAENGPCPGANPTLFTYILFTTFYLLFTDSDSLWNINRSVLLIGILPIPFQQHRLTFVNL